MQSKVEDYRRFKRLFETIAARIKDKKIENPDFPDTLEKGSQIILDATRRQDTTAEGVWTIRPTTRQKAFVEFREMTPQEFYETFLKRAPDGIGFSAEDRMDLAVFLAEAGCGDSAWEQLSMAMKAQPPSPSANPGQPVYDWVVAESTAWQEYYGQGGIKSLYDAYVDLRKQGMRAAELERRRVEIERRAKEFRTVERIYTTDFFILHHSLFGAEGEVPDRLVPREQWMEVVRSLGVPGDAPPTPPQDGGDGGEKKESGTEPKDPVKEPVKDPAKDPVKDRDGPKKDDGKEVSK